MLFSGDLTRHPCFDILRSSGTGYRVPAGLSNTGIITEKSFWIGVYPGMSEEMLCAMAEAIKEALRSKQ